MIFINNRINITKKLAGALFIVGILSSNFAAFAQRPGRVAANKPASAPKCSGAWTGVITYTRQQNQTNNKRVERVSGRGYDTTDWQMDYNYNAQVAVIESPEKNGSSIGKATINHSMTSTEKVEAVESNSCDRGKTWKDMRGSSTSKTEITASQGGLDANVNVGVNEDGTYAVSVGVPQIKGQVSGSQTSSFSGQCTAKAGKNLTMPGTETSVDGHSLTSDGNNRVDPANPNRVSGSYTMNLPGGVAETITWNLQKCGAPLRIIDLKFEDMKFPNWNDWKEVVEQTGTIDGNLVKVKATVLNASGEKKYADLAFKETYKGDKWDGAKPDYPLHDIVSFAVDPGETRDIEMLWNTSGYAWYDDGRPRLVQRVKAEIWEKYKMIDDMTKNIKVAPKPVVLIHGLWASWLTFETWQNIFTTSHSYDWKAFPVGENINKGIINTGREFLSSEQTNSTPDNADAVKKYVQYAQEDRNAWHVDMVAHSVGGVIARYYIQNLMPPNPDDGRPVVEHLVMLGTPNTGSPCADVMDFAFNLTDKSPRVIHDMTTEAMAEFNQRVVSRRGVKFSALAGNPLPTMCKSIVPNDGLVPVPSAIWTIGDHKESSSIHTDLTSTKDFSDFVKPHLAIGPRGDHNPSPDIPGMGWLPRSKRQYGASFAGDNFEESGFGDSVAVDGGQAFARDLHLAPKQSIEIDVPVEAARNFGLTFMADPNISATLLDASGTVVGSNLAGSPESRSWFRSILCNRPTTAGIWKIRLENTGDKESRIVLTTWKDA